MNNGFCDSYKCNVGILIKSYIVVAVSYSNLLLGAKVASLTWKNLSDNREKNFDWGTKDYIFWLKLTFAIIILTCVRLLLSKRENVIIFPVFLVTLYFLIRIHMKLISLDPSVTYKFDLLNSKKLRSYIFVFICHWVRLLLDFSLLAVSR